MHLWQSVILSLVLGFQGTLAKGKKDDVLVPLLKKETTTTEETATTTTDSSTFGHKAVTETEESSTTTNDDTSEAETDSSNTDTNAIENTTTTTPTTTRKPTTKVRSMLKPQTKASRELFKEDFSSVTHDHGAIADLKCWDIAFNLTSATCYDRKEDKVNQDERWSQGGCYSDGVPYSRGSSVPSCCGCMVYYCDWSTKGEYYWRLTSILPYCCQDTNGKIYASGKVISTEKLNDTCSTEITTICKYNGDWNNVTGVITTTHIAPDCCLDNDGKQHPVNKEIPDSTTCSKRICRSGKPTGHWSRCQVEYGINCCLYNGTMIPDGKPLEPQPQPGVNVSCCEGRLVVEYITKSP